MKMCSKCVLPASYKIIRFDSQGVCNYCHSYAEHAERLNDFKSLQGLLHRRLEKMKGKKEYDCLVGLSGGKDSSYVAMKASRDLGLKTLAITFDNGWLTDYGRDNIARVVDALNIDHKYESLDWNVHKVFYREIVRWFGIPCPGCSYAVGMLAHKYAIENDIPFIIHGRSRSQMFRELTDGTSDLFYPFIKQNLIDQNQDLLCANLDATVQKVDAFYKRNVKDEAVLERLRAELLPDVDKMRMMNPAPELLGYFLYYPYDEQQMMAELEQEIGWKRPESKDLLTHTDCLVHDAVDYMYPQVFDYPLLSFEASVLIREGHLTREEAIARVRREIARNQDVVPKESMQILCDRLDLKQEEIPKILASVRTKHKLMRRLLRLKNLWGRKSLDLFQQSS